MKLCLSKNLTFNNHIPKCNRTYEKVFAMSVSVTGIVVG